MADLAISMAKQLTGKVLTGNPYQTNSAKSLMNTINNLMYRNK